MLRIVWVLLGLSLVPVPPADHWHPPQGMSFFWQLRGVPSMHDVQATDMDGFDNDAATVARFHAAAQRTICYIDAGTWEAWRPDSGQFPASVRGRSNGWPGEAWLDIRQLAVLKPLLSARIAMCRDKGFDAVEPDNLDGYTNHTGFPLTSADQLVFNRWLAEAVHAEGMAIFLKNDGDQAAALEPVFDGLINEECNQFHECAAYEPFLRAGKPVVNIEYSAPLYPAFCNADQRAHIIGALMDKALDGKLYKPCPA